MIPGATKYNVISETTIYFHPFLINLPKTIDKNEGKINAISFILFEIIKFYNRLTQPNVLTGTSALVGQTL